MKSSIFYPLCGIIILVLIASIIWVYQLIPKQQDDYLQGIVTLCLNAEQDNTQLQGRIVYNAQDQRPDQNNSTINLTIANDKHTLGINRSFTFPPNTSRGIRLTLELLKIKHAQSLNETTPDLYSLHLMDPFNDEQNQGIIHFRSTTDGTTINGQYQILTSDATCY